MHGIRIARAVAAAALLLLLLPTGAHADPRHPFAPLLTLPTDPGPAITTIDAVTRTLYVTNIDSGTVSVIDLDARPGPSPSFATGGVSPLGVLVDPSTRTLYVTNADSGDVTVLDATRCNARMTAGCVPLAQIATGGNPVGLDVDPVTHTLYVGNDTGDKVFVIDAARCNRIVRSGCAQAPGLAQAQQGAGFVLVDAATRTLYVAAHGTDDDPGDALDVLDMRACNAHVTGGCARAPATVTVGPVPAVATVDPDTHTVYVGHDDNPVVSLVDARHCTALDTSGCDQDPPTTATALVPDAGLALDRAAHRLYAPAPVDDVVSAIDTTRCNAQVHTACDTRWPTIQTGASPSWVTLFEGRLYVADNLDDSVAVLPRRFRDEAPTVLLHEAQEMTVDPDDHTAYVTHANLHELALLDTRVCNARSSSRCHPPEVSIPGVSGPFDIIYDPAERTLYATNQDDHSIVMFDPATCNSARSDGCDPVGPVVHIGRGGWLAVDGARHRVYATDLDDGRVAVLDSRHCNARDFSGCTPSFVPAGPDLFGIAVDPVTGTVYASNSQEATVTVLDRTGAKATIPVGVNPRGLAIDGARRTLYVTNGADGDVPATLSIVDLRHCTAADTSGCGRTWPAVPVGRTPQAVAVDPVTHSVVTSDVLHSTLTFYDAGGRTLGQQAVGFGPQDVEVDPSSGTVFAVNLFEGTVSFTPTR